MKGVSVIIPCYNSGEFIADAVTSVHESRPNCHYEIIIVDDASTDGLTTRVLSDISLDPKVRVFSMVQNGGQSRARNYALEVAKYEIIVPLDADDKIKRSSVSSYLDLALESMDRHPEVFAVTSDYEQFGAMHGLSHVFPFHAQNHLIKSLLPAFSAYRRSEALEMGAYNPDLRFAEDWDFYTAMMNKRFLAGKPMVAVNLQDAHFLYRVHTTGQNASVSQRMKKTQALESLMGRSPEIYDGYYPGKTPAQLGALPSKLRNAFDMAVTSPIDFVEMAGSLVKRRIHNNLLRVFGQRLAPNFAGSD